MTACRDCFDWRLPLAMQARLMTNGATVGLMYHEWLAYHFHVLIHQKNQWAGDFPLDQTLSQAL